MITDLTKQQSNILDANVKLEASWLFDIDTDNDGSPEYYYSTKDKSYGGNSYTFKILDFTPIILRRSEDGIQAPAEMTLWLSNKSNSLTPSNFEGASVTVREIMKAELRAEAEAGDTWAFETASGDAFEASNINETQIRAWEFRVKVAYGEHQTIVLECEDWMQHYLKGDYPNTGLLPDLFPSDNFYDDDLCVPFIFGTAYIPVYSAYKTDARYYILGPSSPTYTISKVRAPRSAGHATEWTSASYTFSQSTKAGADGNNYKAAQFLISDSDNDGTADANGLWLSGERFLPILCKYSRNDTASKTALADLIEYILEDCGVPSAKINAAAQAVVNSTHSSWSLTVNGGFWHKESRYSVLAKLLTMGHMELIVRDDIHMKTHSATAQLVFEKNLVLKEDDIGEPMYTFNPIYEEERKDSGYVMWQDADQPIDELQKTLVAVNGTADHISDETVFADFVQDSQNAQRIGILALQRRLLADAEIKMTCKAKVSHLECDDVITIRPADYGGSFNALIDEMRFNRDFSVDIIATRYA